MEDQKLDLSSLSLKSHPERYQAMVNSIVERATALSSRPASVFEQLQAWFRPTLTLATLGALAALVVVMLLGAGEQESEPLLQGSSAFVIAEWAQSDEIPSTAALMNVIGDYRE